MNNPIVVLDLAEKINAVFSQNGWDVCEEIAITPAVGCVEIQLLLALSANGCSAALNVLHDAGIHYTGTWEDLHTGGMITVPLEIA